MLGDAFGEDEIGTLAIHGDRAIGSGGLDGVGHYNFDGHKLTVEFTVIVGEGWYRFVLCPLGASGSDFLSGESTYFDADCEEDDIPEMVSLFQTEGGLR